jgi:CubicO group peptidase (beta-lactamase class C family)
MANFTRKFVAFLGLFLLGSGPVHAETSSSDWSQFSDQGLAEIQNLMETAIADGHAQSAIAMIAEDGAVRWIGTAGEMGPGIAMREDAIIPLASIGKMFTATAAMILHERGVISLDEPVSSYIPEFADLRIETEDANGNSQLVPPDTPVTIYHLLTHTGGLHVNGDNDYWNVWNEHAGNTTTTEFARALAALPMSAQPGERFQYGGTGGHYEVLAAVIETASGQTLEAFLQENVLQPLAMDDSHFYLPENMLARRPAIYRATDEGLQIDQPMGEPAPRSTYFYGGGGVESTAADLLRFGRLFLEGGEVDGTRILQEETVNLMMRDHLGPLAEFPNGLSWGFGAAVRYSGDTPMPDQYGWNGGGYSRLWMDPRHNLIAYIAFPLTPPGNNALLERFAALVYGAMAAPEGQDAQGE